MLQVSSARLGQGGTRGSGSAGRWSDPFSRVIAQAGTMFEGLLGVGAAFNLVRDARAQPVQQLACHDMLTCAWLCRAGSVLAAAQG